MKIISHRGYWKKSTERNTLVAFRRSFSLGYGTETDLRDSSGRLVVSHDLPTETSIPAEKFFDLYLNTNPSLTLALNIKSDGLQGLLKQFIEAYKIKNYFIFDMSVPDAVVSIKCGLRVFTRHSDLESEPAYYKQAAGVWIDSFCDNSWITCEKIVQHLSANKQVCIVSPELHQRPQESVWQVIRLNGLHLNKAVMLCTDLPELAAAYFKNE